MNQQCPICQKPLRNESYVYYCQGEKDHIYELRLKRDKSAMRASIYSSPEGYVYTRPKVTASIRLNNYDYYYEMNHAEAVFIDTKPIFDPQFLANYFKSLKKLKAFL